MRHCQASFFYRADSILLGLYTDQRTASARFSVETEVELKVSASSRPLRPKACVEAYGYKSIERETTQ